MIEIWTPSPNHECRQQPPQYTLCRDSASGSVFNYEGAAMKNCVSNLGTCAVPKPRAKGQALMDSLSAALALTLRALSVAGKENIGEATGRVRR
jgi:hypothetical protein